MSSSTGALFSPFRCLGQVCDDVPFAVQRRGTQSFVTVSVGKAWQVRGYACGLRGHHACSREQGQP